MRVLALIGLLWSGGAQAECRLALALALDVSGSVDQTEYKQQLEGVATALVDPSVASVILANPETPIALAIFEWSSSTYHRIVQNWVLLDSQDSLNSVAARLSAWKRDVAPEATGIGAALQFARQLFDQGPDCWAQTLDISGDGKNNDFPTPIDVRKSGELLGLRVNALVVVRSRTSLAQREVGELPAYFKSRIIQGPDAFVEVALGYEDYARAMQKKLLREIAALPLGGWPIKGTRFVMMTDR